MSRRVTSVLAAIGLALLMAGAAQSASAKQRTVKISGKAFIFNHMDTYISGATIKVRELPKLSATTDELGDYELTVPNDANVTPYIVSGSGLLTKHSFADDSPTGQVQANWHEVDLQTFHTRGQDIENANFQTPQDLEYEGLKALLQVPAREDGRPEQCVIVTTASARNVRTVDYHTYWENTPHGVPGATAIEFPALDGPTYFNEHVIPDPTETATSEDGGIIWPIVPTGRYRIVTSAPDARFASFLATCKPGRVINANPPWGAYQLDPGEKPLRASNVAGKVASAKVVRAGKRKRVAVVRIATAERLEASVRVRAGKRKAGRALAVKPGAKKLKFRIGPRIRSRKAVIRVKLEDASGVAYTTVKKVKLPKVRKAGSRAKRR